MHGYSKDSDPEGETPATHPAKAGGETTSIGNDGKEEAAFYGFQPFPRRGPAVTNELINRLRDGER